MAVSTLGWILIVVGIVVLGLLIAISILLSKQRTIYKALQENKKLNGETSKSST